MDADALAARLIEARRRGRRIAQLSLEEAPSDAAEGYALQDAVIARLGGKIAGWKVGAASPEALPQAGALLVDRVQPSPARFVITPHALRLAEAELAFRFGRDLPARAAPYGEAEIWDAVATLHVAIEVLDSAFVDRRFVPVFAPLGDLNNNGAFCYGPAVEAWRNLDLSRPQATLLIDGKPVRQAQSGTPGGHPRRLLTWLANHGAATGRPLRSGDIVTTGSHTGMYEAPVGAEVTAKFAGIGEASLILVLAGDAR